MAPNPDLSGCHFPPLMDETVLNIRNALLEEAENDPDHYDMQDVEQFVEDGYILRYLQRHKGDEEKTIEAIKKMLAWRKERGLNRYHDLFVAKEFYKMGAVFIYNEDNEGNPCLYIRCKFHLNIPQMKLAVDNFIAYTMFKVDKLAADKGPNYGWNLILDFTELTMAQYDIGQLTTILRTVLEYMPSGFKRLLLYNVPWFLKHPLKCLVSMAGKESRDLIKVVSQDQLFKYIPRENFPRIMGGECEKSTRVVPRGARLCRELAAENYDLFKLDDPVVVKLTKVYDDFLLKILETENDLVEE